MAEETSAEKQHELFPLDATERIVSFRDKDTGEWYRHTLQPPTQALALEYYRSLTYREKDGSRQVDVVTPALKLYAALFRSVQGYRSVDAQRIPRLHRLAAIQLLENVAPDPTAPADDVDPAYDFAVLRAPFSPAAGENEMRWFSGLAHAFEPFSAEEDVEFSRELNRPIVVGGSRSGETLRPLRQAVLLRWYDKKIRAAQGYAIPQDAEQTIPQSIVARMDPFHKLAAFERLLSGATNIELPRPVPTDRDSGPQDGEEPVA